NRAVFIIHPNKPFFFSGLCIQKIQLVTAIRLDKTAAIVSDPPSFSTVAILKGTDIFKGILIVKKPFVMLPGQKYNLITHYGHPFTKEILIRLFDFDNFTCVKVYLA